MALSNWDTLAFDNDGKACNGVFTGSDGTTVEIYKNWLYVRHPLLITDEEKGHRIGFTINHGDVNFGSLTIVVIRGSQQSVFVYAREGWGEDAKCFAGIGAYGYEDNTERVCLAAGLTKEQIGQYKDIEISSSHGEDKEGDKWHIQGYKVKMEDLDFHDGSYTQHMDEFETEYDETLEPQFVGVLPETAKEFFAWVEECIKEEGNEKDALDWLEKCKSAEALRFNQGDQFFVSQLGDQTPATKPGEAEPTIMSAIIDTWKKGE